MKKLLSVLLCAVMLVAPMTIIGHADEPAVDKAMLLDDLYGVDPTRTGDFGYIVNTDAHVKEQELYFSFDLNALSATPCTHRLSTNPDYRHQSGLTLFAGTGDRSYSAFVYDVLRQEFQIATAGWPRGSGVDTTWSGVYASAPYEMKPGEWHHVEYIIEAQVYWSIYVDGELILEHEFSGGKNGSTSRQFLMMWPSHCRVMIDNLTYGTFSIDYDFDKSWEENIEAGEATVYGFSDFNDSKTPIFVETKEEPTYVTEKEHRVYGDTEDNRKKNRVGETIVYEDNEENRKKEQVGLPVEYDKKDADGNKIYKQAVDENGNLLFNEDGTPQYEQEVDEETGELKFHNTYYWNVDGAIVKNYYENHAICMVEDHGVDDIFGDPIKTEGFNFSTMDEYAPCKGVDKATCSGMLTESDEAAISFADVGDTNHRDGCVNEGQTISAAINYDSTKGEITSAKNLVLALDPLFVFNKFDNIASGVTIAEHDGLVDLTIPAGFSGKLADIVLDIPATVPGTSVANEMAQSDNYRYGFMTGASTTGADGIVFDAGAAYTKNFTKGDVNDDGRINAKDVALIMIYTARKTVDDPVLVKHNFSLKAANIYTDSAAVNARDITSLIRYLAGWGGEYSDLSAM